jgi:outer membrane protein assembly factor BamB
MAMPAVTFHPKLSENDWFGDSVLVIGSNFVVGAPRQYASTPKQGNGHVYVFNDKGTQVHELSAPPGGPPTDRFGIDLAATNDGLLVVGASTDEEGGSVYIFDPGTGRLVQTLPAPKGALVFGRSVASHGPWLLIGADKSVYVYRK